MKADIREKLQYSAAASLLGHIYQCRLTLLESLKRLKSDPDIAVAIETIDDVVFEKDSSSTEVIQLKHYLARKAGLANASTDLCCLRITRHGGSTKAAVVR